MHGIILAAVLSCTAGSYSKGWCEPRAGDYCTYDSKWERNADGWQCVPVYKPTAEAPSCADERTQALEYWVGYWIEQHKHCKIDRDGWKVRAVIAEGAR